VKLHIDTDARTLQVLDGERVAEMPLYSDEAFRLLSRLWEKVGWDLKYSYGFTWMGRPVIQLPEDMIRIQETFYRVRPDVVIETGVAHGGSLVFYASVFRAMGHGRVVGVDIEIRPHNRAAIESHELASLITLIEGDSTAESTLRRVREQVKPGERTLIILDSSHTRTHVLAELEAYAPLVSPGSCIVATDGIMQELGDVPHGNHGWTKDNPQEAAREFAARHTEFVLQQPPFLFSETKTTVQTTHWPNSYLWRKG
jgi:cephalosporin hydroxylase